jgi:hypothetical protein
MPLDPSPALLLAKALQHAEMHPDLPPSVDHQHRGLHGAGAEPI